MTRIAQRPPEIFARVVADRHTAPFWQAAAEGRLICARCADCGRFRMPPSPFCPACRSQRVEWPELPGTGTVYSYTVIERAVMPGGEANVPYVVAVVSLDGAEPARLIANVVESPVDAVVIGARVSVLFDAAGEFATPRFRIVE